VALARFVTHVIGISGRQKRYIDHVTRDEDEALQCDARLVYAAWLIGLV